MLIFHSYVSLSEGINHFPKVQTPGIRLYPGDRGASLTRWCRHRRPCQRPCLGARFFKRNDEARWTKPGTMASPCFYMEYRCTYGVLYIFIYTIYTYLYIQYVFLMCFFFLKVKYWHKIITWNQSTNWVHFRQTMAADFFFTPVGWLKLHNAPGLDQHRMMGYIHPVDVQ